MRIAMGLIAAVAFTGGFLQFSVLSNTPHIAVTEVESAPETKEMSAFVTLEKGLNREAITDKIGSSLAYDAAKIHKLHDTYRAMQWDAYNDIIVPYLVEAYDLNKEEEEILLTHSTAYLTRDDDILESLYESGAYTFSSKDSIVEVVEKLLDPVLSDKEARVPELLLSERIDELLVYVRTEMELLPDLVPLPPQDVSLVHDEGRTLLAFTTIYYNRGTGNLELRADPLTIGTLGDFDREVYQRIYRRDGTFRERSSGSFIWHNEHIHYHFSDFIEYRLEAVSQDSEEESQVLAEKSTFCIRDVSRVYIDGNYSSTSATYQICGRERQGVSVGWGDAYFSTYPDQNLDISMLPSGTYTLTFIANPADRFDEVTKENNVSRATIVYSKEDGTVEVISIEPRDLPEFEHIHVEQNF